MSDYPFGLRAWPTADVERDSALEVVAAAIMDMTLAEVAALHTRDDVRKTPYVHPIRGLTNTLESCSYTLAGFLLDAQEHLNKSETRVSPTAKAFVALAKQMETGV
jgi:hypothetical protein